MSKLKINVLLTCLAVLALWSCQGKGNASEEAVSKSESAQAGSKTNTVIVKGNATNAPAASVVYLEKRFQNTYSVMDSVILDDNGNFAFTVGVDEPNLYSVNFMKEARTEILLNNTDVVVEADMTDAHNPKIKISGSQDTDFLSEYRVFQRGAVQKLDSLKSAAAFASDKMAARENYQKELDQVVAEALGKAQKMKNSVVALALLESGMVDLEKNIDAVAGIAENLSKLYPTSKMVTSFQEKIDAIKMTTVGTVAPNFTLYDSASNPIELSSLRGKYVLLDFWASWCKPCRHEIPNMKKAYKKYKGDKFEIYSVSIDRNPGDWKSALVQENMAWVNVYDNNDIGLKKYNARFIPLTFLLDPQGVIIEKNLRGKRLEEKLDELFKAS